MIDGGMVGGTHSRADEQRQRRLLFLSGREV
jgi:hypothetical protein